MTISKLSGEEDMVTRVERSREVTVSVPVSSVDIEAAYKQAAAAVGKLKQALGGDPLNTKTMREIASAQDIVTQLSEQLLHARSAEQERDAIERVARLRIDADVALADYEAKLDRLSTLCDELIRTGDDVRSDYISLKLRQETLRSLGDTGFAVPTLNSNRNVRSGIGMGADRRVSAAVKGL